MEETKQESPFLVNLFSLQFGYAEKNVTYSANWGLIMAVMEQHDVNHCHSELQAGPSISETHTHVYKWYQAMQLLNKTQIKLPLSDSLSYG